MKIQDFKFSTLRTFIPAKDFQRSRAFYKKLGFEEIYSSDGLAVFQVGDFTFHLQNYYQKEWAENFMMLLEVDDVDKFWKYVQSLDLQKEFPAIKLKKPENEDWARVFRLSDPTGVLWHMVKFTE
ncbi:MAG: VOC family protein [Bacteroidota bacterium]